MIYIYFSEQEINQLNYERYHYPHHLVQKRMETLYLKSQKLSHQDICRLCGMAINLRRDSLVRQRSQE